MKVYLVSPGQTDWTTQKRLNGSLDIPLNALGETAVEELARSLAGDRITTVYCPTALDGRQTATIIARITKAKVCPRRDLNEADPGLWQGLTAEELKRRHPHVYARWIKSPASVLPPRGEAFTMVFGRVSTVLDELKRHKSDDAVVCVVPSVIRRILAGRLRGLEPDALPDVPEHDGGIDMVEI
jgi:phosphoserine phosphatase